MSSTSDIKGKRPMGPLTISKPSPKKTKQGSPDVLFMAINHAYYFQYQLESPATLGTDKYKMQSNHDTDPHNPLPGGRCGALVNLPIGCFSNLPSDFRAFGNGILNNTQPGFPNNGLNCDNLDPPLIWADTLRSTYNHPAKNCFPVSERKHVTIISSMLPYSPTYREYLINDIRKNIPGIHIDNQIAYRPFCVHIQDSTEITNGYIVTNPSGNNWADIAFLTPTLMANDLLEIGVDNESNCFLVLPDKEAYDKFVRILTYLRIDYALNAHLNSQENSTQDNE